MQKSFMISRSSRKEDYELNAAKILIEICCYFQHYYCLIYHYSLRILQYSVPCA